MSGVAIAAAVAALCALAAWWAAPRALTPPRCPGRGAPVRRGRRRELPVAALRWTRRAPSTPTATPADDLELVARLIRSGSSIASAIGQAADAGAGASSLLRTIEDRRAAGVPLPDAIASTTGAGPDERLVLAVLGAVTGGAGPGANALDRAAATIRERADARAERRAHAAQARLSARIMSFLPVGFTAWIILTDTRTAGFVAGSPIGMLCLVTGIGLDLLGWRWMNRIVGVQ